MTVTAVDTFKQLKATNTNVSFDNVPSTSSVATADSKCQYIYKDTVVTPNFRSKRLKWSLPMNYYRYYKETYSGTHGLLIQPQTGGFIRREGDALHLYAAEPSTTFSFGTTLTSLDRQARTKIRLKLKDQKTNLAQVYAERQQIADLIGDTALRLAKAMVALKKGNLAEAGKNLGVHTSNRAVKKHKKAHKKSQSKATASGWLQLQYGWLPLLGDVVGAAELLAQKLSNEIKGRVVASASREYDEFHNLGYQNVAYPGIEKKYVKAKAEIKYVVYYATTASSLKTAAQIGITNPLQLAWELVPFSFVADWFLPIGDYLSSLDATFGLQFLKGSRTYFVSTNVHCERKGGILPDGRSTWVDIRSRRTLVDTQRTVLTDFPSIAMPVFENPFTLTRAANAIALLRVTALDTFSFRKIK